jgi:hypothetical protein
VKKFAAIALGILILLAILAAGLYLAGPTLIASRVETELHERLERKGVEAEWSNFEAGFGGEFIMRDASFAVPRFGATLEAETIDVRVDPRSVLEQPPSVESVRLEGVRVRVDLDALQREDDTEGSESKGGTGSSLVRAILESPPGIELDRAALELVRSDEPVASVTASRATFAPIDRGWEVVAAGASQIEVEGVPAVFRKEVPWDLVASVYPLDLRADFRVAGPDSTPLVAVEEKELVRAELGAVAGRIDAKKKSLQTELESVSLRLGPASAPGIDLAVDRTRADLEPGRVAMVAALSPRLTVTPSKLGPVREGVSWLRALVGAPDDTDEETGDETGAANDETDAGSSDHDSDQDDANDTQNNENTENNEPPKSFVPLRYRVASAWERLTSVASTTDLYLDDFSFAVKIESAVGNTFDTITVLETLDARAVDGHVSVDGRTAGGTLSGTAKLVPGSSWPLYVEGAISDVKLEEMPGMPEKRSELPNRGTSGRVGGELDAVFALAFPTLGSDGPLLQTPSFAFASLDWSDGVIDLTGVSEEPLEEIDLSFDFIGRGYPALNDFDVLDATLRYGPAVVRGRGAFTDAPLDPTFVVRAELEEIECQELFRAAPVGLLGPYRALEMEGEWAPKFYMKLPLFRPRGFRMQIEEYEDLCTITDLRTYNKWLPDIVVKESAPTGPHLHARPLPEERLTNPRWDDVFWLNAPFVKRVTEGVSSEEVVVKVGPGLPSYVPLHEMPGYVGGAAFLSEEMDFYDDGPINLNLIKKAVRLNLEKGRFQYGGSTVTQQLVKNLFLTRDKTFARKFQEALIAWRITDVVSKDRVLELYLNCIEYGPDVYGIGPAAQFYFQKDARQLTAKEAIFLAMLKPAPWYGMKVIERRKTPVTGWWAGRYEELYQRLIDYDYLTRAQADAEKPYFLEWDRSGKYIPAAIPVPDAPDDGLDLLELP